MDTDKQRYLSVLIGVYLWFVFFYSDFCKKPNDRDRGMIPKVGETPPLQMHLSLVLLDFFHTSSLQMAQVSLVDLIAGARTGKLVSFPTDTVPALATLPAQAGLIFAAKKRSQDKPLILMAASGSDLWPYVQGSDIEYKVWQEITDKYWPGGLTLVLPASALVPKVMNPTDPTTIGVRVPASAIAQSILSQTGPLATTSANVSGQPPLQTMAEIAEQFPEALTLSTKEFPQQVSAGCVPSTVAKWTGMDWEILRSGAIKLNF